ncbi:MAG: glycoside hydrolase family 5 protein [Tepidisphaerales bacterium]
MLNRHPCFAGLFRRVILAALLAALCVLPAGAAQDDGNPVWLPASAEKLPRWRGFNLLEKFVAGRNSRPFQEEDFRLIEKLGFNFVRLPMDYRGWIKDGNWETFDEAALKEIDQAVEWGNKYHIHVSLNFHRAPGYTVNAPAEKTSLWTDAETQRVCGLHWATFAKRYKGIPNARLSFNLLNEPAKIKPELFVAAIRSLVAAIRTEDPDRLIISDGLEWGRVPVLELADLHIAQAARGYAPMEISHYKASWVASEKYPYPAWPMAMRIPGTLAGPGKPQSNHAIVVDGPFAAATDLRLHVDKVSVAANLIVEADGKPVYEKAFKPGPGEGEWKKVVFAEQWKVYQNIYDRDYTATIPAGTKQVQIRMTEGDWVNVSEIGFKPAGAARENVLATEEGLDKKGKPFRYAPADAGGPFVGVPMRDKQWLAGENVKPWQVAQTKGIGVMVGEWGAFNKTPHEVFLRWAEDNLDLWKKADMGWAMWNFRGSFGVLDSGRSDVQYEDFEGHKLDRKLLELLKRY